MNAGMHVLHIKQSHTDWETLVFNLMQVMIIMHLQNTTFLSEVFLSSREQRLHNALVQKK